MQTKAYLLWQANKKKSLMSVLQLAENPIVVLPKSSRPFDIEVFRGIIGGILDNLFNLN
jgi:hypothetical protein